MGFKKRFRQKDSNKLIINAKNSLKRRLVFVLTGSLTLLLAVGGVGLYLLQRQLLENEFDRESFRRIGEVMRDVSRHSPQSVVLPDNLRVVKWIDNQSEKSWTIATGANLEIDSVSKILDSLSSENPSRVMAARLSDGSSVRVFVRKFTPPPGKMPTRSSGADKRRGADDMPPMPPLETPPGSSDAGDKADSSDVVVEHSVIDAGGDGEPGKKALNSGRPDHRRRWTPPTGTIIVAADRATLDSALRLWLTIVLVSVVAGEIIVVAVVLMAVNRGLEPLRPLAAEISSINSASLSTRVSTRDLPDELRPVVAQVNSLLERLEAAFVREQDFTASAAHELRTPLAGMRTQLEVLLRRPREVEDYSRTCGQCLTLVKSMQVMIDAMLEMARLDSAAAAPARQRLDLVTLSRGAWENFSGQRDDITFLLDSPPELLIDSDAALLGRVISNLLANACEYSDPDTQVQMRLWQRDRTTVIEIANCCRHLRPGDIDKMFERLWRSDAARSDAAVHCGLGLAIVARATELLGGQIDTQLHEHVVAFRVVLPAADAPKRPAGIEKSGIKRAADTGE